MRKTYARDAYFLSTHAPIEIQNHKLNADIIRPRRDPDPPAAGQDGLGQRLHGRAGLGAGGLVGADGRGLVAPPQVYPSLVSVRDFELVKGKGRNIQEGGKK